MKRGILAAALLAPLAALGQEEGWSPPPLVEAEPGAPVPYDEVPAASPAAPAIIFPDEGPGVSLGSRSVAGSVFLEGLLGGLGGAGFGLGGLLVGCLADQVTSQCQGGATVGAIAGGSLGIILGVYLAGALMDGDGWFLAAALGEVIGLAGGVVVLLVAGVSTATLIPFVALPLIGAIIGYEVSTSPGPPAVSLGAGPSRDGGWVFGLVGAF